METIYSVGSAPSNNCLHLYFQDTDEGLTIEIEEIRKQAEKLKSREMKEGWMMKDEWRMIKDEWRMTNDEGWMMNDEGWWFQAVEGFWLMTDRQTNERTDGHLWL